MARCTDERIRFIDRKERLANVRKLVARGEGCNHSGQGEGMPHRKGVSRGEKCVGSNGGLVSNALKMSIESEAGFAFEEVYIGYRFDKNGRTVRTYMAPFFAFFLDDECRDCFIKLNENTTDPKIASMVAMLTDQEAYNATRTSIISILGDTLKACQQFDYQRTLIVELPSGERRIKIYINPNGIPMSRISRYNEIANNYLDLTSEYVQIKTNSGNMQRR